MKNVMMISVVTLIFSTTASFAEETCEAMFVQDAKSMTFDGSNLMLKDANPDMIYFCDRPVREAGHLSQETFLKWGSEGEDSFAKNHPNAAVSILGPGDEVASVVVELSGRPVISGNDITYPVKELDGELPNTGGKVIIFIDPLGRPLSPNSVAGVHRRHERRARR